MARLLLIHSFIHSFILPVLFVSLIAEFAVHGQISRPAAFLEVTIPPSSSVAIALPFDPFPTNFYESVYDQLGDDAFVLWWNASKQTYEPATNSSRNVSAGDAFWVVNESDGEKRIFLSGAISSDNKTVTVIPQLSLIGNPSVSAISNHTFTLDGDLVIDPRTPELNSERLPIGQGMWYSRRHWRQIFTINYEQEVMA